MNDIEKTLNRRIGQLLKGGEREIAKHYAQILKDIRALLGIYYEKYEQGGELSLEELAKYNRLQRLNREIKEMFQEGYEEVGKVINQALEDVYEEGYYLTAWAISNEANVELPTALKPELVLASVANPITGLTLNERLEKNRGAIEWKIRETVTKSVVEGTPYGTLAKELKEVLEGDEVKAMRIVRTEVHRVSEEAKQTSREHAHELGIIQVKKWLSMEDERVRSSHEMLNNEKVPVDEPFEIRGMEAMQPGGFGVAREDINCRCITTTEIVEIVNKDLKERTSKTYEEYVKGAKK